MKKRKILVLAAVLAVLLLTAGCGETGQGKQEDLKGNMVLSFINIGKGDAFLIQVPDGGYYMWDTGKEEDYPMVERLLDIKKVERLDGIFLSHGHKDHAGGLELIMEKYSVEKVYLSGKDDITYKKINPEQTASEYGAEVVKLQGDEVLSLGGATAQVWIPGNRDTENENNNSMVVRWSFKDTSFLMTGDMEKKEEKQFLQTFEDCRADVLKLGHHGEKDATSKALLEAVMPVYGIITGNEEENPDSVNKKIAERLKKYGVKAYYSEGEQTAWDFIADGTSVKAVKVMDK
ncbi:MBL fold metallo-hydrolase [Blautia coccoides]|uniref:ComEC/Rec2 family competence protein n=1 Tax=Blautia producta TaxID=33035 RepID=UPI00210C5C77|nr:MULTISPECIES: MBL fold metallo-hydrolase [Blautia]MCQ4745172.1 MBL fold metallo-hydrolase [Blautia producta]MCR1988941.1 MBL fold metallo-hydrolase [Blautia coccoides]